MVEVVTDAERLATLAIELLSTINPRNLARPDRGTAGDILVWRRHAQALAAELDRQYPEWLNAVQQDRKAAR